MKIYTLCVFRRYYGGKNYRTLFCHLSDTVKILKQTATNSIVFGAEKWSHFNDQTWQSMINKQNKKNKDKIFTVIFFFFNCKCFTFLKFFLNGNIENNRWNQVSNSCWLTIKWYPLAVQWRRARRIEKRSSVKADVIAVMACFFVLTSREVHI